MKTCTFEGCERKYNAKGLCSVHYRILQNEGVLRPIGNRGEYARANKILICSFPECGKKHEAKGYCKGHWSQLHYGRPLQALGLPKMKKIRGPYIRKPKGKCSIYECEGIIQAREMCSKHYSRFMRHGDPRTCYIRSRKSDYVSVDNVLKNKVTYSKEDEREILRESFGDLYDKYDRENNCI